MKINGRIVTLTVSPAWDLTCTGDHLTWGEHPVLDDQSMTPAGKALNISRALAWLGHDSIAAGLWGQHDYKPMQTDLAATCPHIAIRMTPVPGRTRINVTILDAASKRELHLRARSTLTSPKTIQCLSGKLTQLVKPQDVCVLSGSLPDVSLTEDTLALTASCLQKPQTRLVLDAHGPVFQSLVEVRLPWLIKPNVAELNELLGTRIRNTPASLVKAARTLLDRVPLILISRGKAGAILVTDRKAWLAQCLTKRQALSTVGCGDFLLAGFLAGLTQSNRLHSALELAIRTATARAWGWSDRKSPSTIKKHIRVQITQL